MNRIKVICQEGETVEIDQDVAERSVLIKNMLDEGGSDEAIPLVNVKRPILEKIVSFCIHLRNNDAPDIEKPLRSANLADLTTAWYADFIDLE